MSFITNTPIVQSISDLSITNNIGITIQAHNATLDNISSLLISSGNFIVGNGTAFVAESGLTARTSLGLGDIATMNQTSFVKTDGTSLIVADLNINSNKIINVATPLSSNDAVNKLYVDNIATGLDVKKSVIVGTTVNIILSGTQTIDTIILAVGNRVLVKNQTIQTENGIYDVAIGTWSRSSDADNTPLNEVSGGMFTFIENGLQTGTGWILNNIIGNAVLGVDALLFTQFSNSSTILAGTNLTKVGNTINLNSVLTNFSSTGIIDNAISTKLIIDGNGIKPQLGSFAIPPGGTGLLYGSLTLGQSITGSGTTYDISILNKNGSFVSGIPTGTVDTIFSGILQVNGSLNAQGNIIVTGATTSQGKIQFSSSNTGYSIIAGNDFGTMRHDVPINTVYTFRIGNIEKIRFNVHGLEIKSGDFVPPSAGTGLLYGSLTLGQTITGSGTTYDVSALNKNGSFVSGVLTGTTDTLFLGTINVNSSNLNQTLSSVIARRNGDCVEFGHNNQLGYGSGIGASDGNGHPRISFCTTAGTFTNTFKTLGLQGSLVEGWAGEITFKNVPNVNLDNQVPVDTFKVKANGDVIVYGTTDSSSITTGSLTVSGGIGIAKNLQVGARVGIGIVADTSYPLTISSIGSSTIRINSSGQLGFINLDVSGELKIWSHGALASDTVGIYTGTGSGLRAASFSTTAITFDHKLSVSQNINATGFASSWGVTNGVNTGAFNAVISSVIGTATWLLSGTSAGIFRYGIQGLASSDVLKIYAGPANPFVFTGSGKFSVGAGTITANPSIDDIVINTTNVAAGLTIGTAATGIAYIAFAKPTSNNGGYISYNHNTDILTFRTAAATQLTIEPSAINCQNNVLSTFNSTDSTSTSTGSIHTSGGLGVAKTIIAGTGIKLGGIAASNLLNHYETGIWTPTVRGNTIAGTYTVSSSGNTFTRIGNMVTVMTSITFTIASGGTGAIIIGGLPYNYVTGINISSPISFEYLNLVNTNPAGVMLLGLSSGSDNQLIIGELVDNGAWVLTPATGISTSTVIRMNLTYFTA